METNHNIDTENDVFNRAADLVEYTDKFIYLTGKAGTGKTTFLHHIINKTSKNTVILAQTGVAAYNCGGITVNSFFQLPSEPIPPYDYKISEPTWKDRLDSIREIINKYNFPKRKVINNLELVIIDEVSMVRADVIDAIDTILRVVRNNPNVAFGGVQVLLIGDPFQLPPVTKNDEWDLFRKYYDSAYFFSSHVIKQNPPVRIELKKIYRQKDEMFINLLNRIRINELRDADYELLNSRVIQYPDNMENSRLTISTHNQTVDDINSYELKKVDSQLFEFRANITGEFNAENVLAKSLLSLKTGARVMFVKNDVGSFRKFFNGKLGIVKDFKDDKIVVECDDGIELEVERVKWINNIYDYDNNQKKLIQKEIGVFEQFPLRLAWAITVHKSQGLTFESINLDLQNSFDSGQVYVAMSRCTSFDGLNLLSPIIPEAIKTAPAVLNYSSKVTSLETLNSKPVNRSENSLVLSHLLTYEAFKRYLNSIPDNDEFIIEPNEDELNNDIILQDAIKGAKTLGYLITQDSSHVTLKMRHLNQVKTYMINNCLLSRQLISELYSRKNPKYEDSINELFQEVKDGILLRHKYLKAFQEIRANYDIADEIRIRFTADLKESDYKKADINSKSAMQVYSDYASSMATTESVKGKTRTPNYSLVNLGLDIRDKAENSISELNNSEGMNDNDFKDVWLKKREHLLSPTNLKKLSKLLVKTYKELFNSEIKKTQRKKYNEKDRLHSKQKYQPIKKYSKDEKIEFVKNNPQWSNLELAQKLDCTERTIRDLKKEI